MQEPAILALFKAVKECWTGEIVPDSSPVGDHQSNGAVEAGIRTLEAQTRAVKMQLERRYNIDLDHASPLIPWIMLETV